MVELCVQVFEIGLAEHKQPEAEVNAFLRGHRKVVSDYQRKASQILTEFEEQHHERTWELQHLSDQDTLQVKVDLCNDAIKLLSASLMTLELMLHKQRFQDIIKELNINISDMVVSFSETVQGIYCRFQCLESVPH